METDSSEPRFLYALTGLGLSSDGKDIDAFYGVRAITKDELASTELVLVVDEVTHNHLLEHFVIYLSILEKSPQRRLMAVLVGPGHSAILCEVAGESLKPLGKIDPHLLTVDFAVPDSTSEASEVQAKRPWWKRIWGSS